MWEELKEQQFLQSDAVHSLKRLDRKASSKPELTGIGKSQN
jgi:hypothetical protein